MASKEEIIARLIHAEDWQALEKTAFHWGADLLSGEGEVRWFWATAQIAYEYGGTSTLEALVVGEIPMDEGARDLIGGIVAGRVKPNAKGAAKLKVEAEERADQLMYCVATLRGFDDIRSHASVVADVLAVEPCEVRKICKRITDHVREQTMQCCGFGPDSLSTALKKARKLLKNSPSG